MSEIKSTRGRKKKAETKTYKMQFLIEESIKEELEVQADRIGLELKDYVRWILTQKARNIDVRTQVVASPELTVEGPQTISQHQEARSSFEAEDISNQSTTHETQEKTNILKNSMFGKK